MISLAAITVNEDGRYPPGSRSRWTAARSFVPCGSREHLSKDTGKAVTGTPSYSQWIPWIANTTRSVFFLEKNCRWFTTCLNKIIYSLAVLCVELKDGFKSSSDWVPWPPSWQELGLNTALISYHTGNNKRHGSSSIWTERHPRGTHTGQNYLTSSIQQTALQIILSPSIQTHLDFSGFSVERREHSQGILIRCGSSRSKCAYTKKALSVLSCWAWLKRGRERELKKLPFVLKNVRASNQNTVVAKDCCSPPTISLSEQKTDPFTSKLCSFSPRSPPTSAPHTRHRHTNSSPEPATHNGCRTHFQKIHPRNDVVSTKFKGAAFNLSCWQTRLQQAPGCTWCIYKKPGTMFVLLLKDVIFTLQDFTDCRRWLQQVKQ